MKKVLGIILSLVVLNSVSFSATSLDQSLSNLEQQLAKLDQMEEQKFNEQKALAAAAQNRLDKYMEMDSVIDERIASIEATYKNSIFGKEFKDKSNEYKSLKSQLATEIKKEQKIIMYQLLDALEQLDKNLVQEELKYYGYIK